MYRCTECKAEYTELPDFCDCGNDSFEEIYEEEENINNDNYIEEESERVHRPSRRPAKRLTHEEYEELEAEKVDKMKSLITLGVSVVICIIILICPPHLPKKVPKPKIDPSTNVKVEFPSVKQFWLDGPSKPVYLNSRLGSLDQDLRQYLLEIGNEMKNKWNWQTVEGKGDCLVELAIDKQGGLTVNKIFKPSGNADLDNSIALLLSKITYLGTPPDSYKGEHIVMKFSVDSSMVSQNISFPSMK